MDEVCYSCCKIIPLTCNMFHSLINFYAEKCVHCGLQQEAASDSN